MFATFWKKRCPISKGQRSLKLGNEEYVSIMAVGLMEVCFDNKILRISDCLFVLDFNMNLVSASCLVEYGLTV